MTRATLDPDVGFVSRIVRYYSGIMFGISEREVEFV